MKARARRRGKTARGSRLKKPRRTPAGVRVVSGKQLLALQKKIQKPAAVRWNPDKDDVQRSVIRLVLTLVELIRKLMERQAIRRMEERTLTPAETDAVGTALMEIERTIRDIGRQFDLSPEDLNLDLGVIKLL
jgi:hypothetical protein